MYYLLILLLVIDVLFTNTLDVLFTNIISSK